MSHNPAHVRAIYSIPEAAKLLGISKQSAYDLVRRNQFPAPTIKCGRRVVVPKAPLDQLLGLIEQRQGISPESQVA